VDNLKYNKPSVFNLAIGEKDGTVKMFSHLEHDTSSSILKSTDLCGKIYPFTKKQTLIQVKLTTLDNAVGNLPNPLTPEILIKMDIQGYEGRVIEGGKETLSKAEACIIEIDLDSLYEG